EQRVRAGVVDLEVLRTETAAGGAAPVHLADLLFCDGPVGVLAEQRAPAPDGAQRVAHGQSFASSGTRVSRSDHTSGARPARRNPTSIVTTSGGNVACQSRTAATRWSGEIAPIIHGRIFGTRSGGFSATTLLSRDACSSAEKLVSTSGITLSSSAP